jgi:hypothetical protein
MYGLPQAGKIANGELVPHLTSHGYQPPMQTHTPPLLSRDLPHSFFPWRLQLWSPVYVGCELAKHLASIMAAKYKMTTNWTGNLYCGITLKWDYSK